MNNTDVEQIMQILLEDPESGEELKICSRFYEDAVGCSFIVSNLDGTKYWKHEIWTKEITGQQNNYNIK